MRKNIIFAALSSLAVVFAVSCAKETPVSTTEGEEIEPGYKEVTLTAGVTTKVNSKDDIIRWNTAKESLAVFGQIGGNMVKYQFIKPEITGVTTPTEAEFKGTVSENAVLKYAAYPYDDTDERCGCTAEGVLSMYASESPSYYATNSIASSTPLYAVISGESVTMKSACAYLKVTLPGEEAVFGSVKVTADNICGAFTVDCSGETPVISAGTKNEISFTPRKNSPGNIYIPVIPGTYDNVKISVEYNDGYPAFVKQSESSNTFVAGMFYDCKTVSGARVESVTSGDCTIEGTSLTMNASAAVWKYSGVTNDAYTAKFFYAEQGVEKGAAGWNEVEATISGNEGNNVTLSATATIEAGKSYQYYAQVSDGTKVVESEAVAAVAKEKRSVKFTFSTDKGNFEYLEPQQGKQIGYRKVVTEDGTDAFPTFSPSANKADYYYKKWDGSNYGQIESIKLGSAGDINGMVGGTIRKEEYSITIVPTAKFYTLSSSKLCVISGFSIRLDCPSGYKITNIRLQTAKNDNCTWGLGATSGSCDIVSEQAFKNTSADVDANIPVPKATTDTPYYLVSGASNNRLMSIEITYEK